MLSFRDRSLLKTKSQPLRFTGLSDTVKQDNGFDYVLVVPACGDAMNTVPIPSG